MMRRSLLFLLVLFLKAFAYGQTPTISLNGEWRFTLAKSADEANKLSTFYQQQFDLSGFKKIPVPSNWAVLGFEEPVYRGFDKDQASEGFYIKDFTAEKDLNSNRVLLHFGGVWSSAQVWLNGQLLGEHIGGYSAFAFNISGKLKTGLNRLAVRVKQNGRDYKFDTYDDWTLGGIFRDVYLERMPSKRWLDEVVVRTHFDPDYKDAELLVRTMVGDKHKETLPGNYPSPGKAYDLLFSLVDQQGKLVQRRKITVPAHYATEREIKERFHIQTPHQWNAEHPYLYHLQVDLLEDGKPAHTRVEPVGFREVSTAGGVFKINGQAVKLRGVNLHDEYPDVGRASTRSHWLKDIQMMKAANINYIRLCHYAHPKGFIELCDSLGMYLGAEVSLGGAGELMRDPSFVGSVLTRTYETVQRDLNNPSIVYWSVGNEDPLTSLLMSAVRVTKALDPTRPVLLPWRHETWLPDEIDILAPHYWLPREYDSLAAISKRPIITTEYTHAFGVNAFGGLKERWKALTSHPAGAGGAIWMWADQGIKTPVAKAKNIKGDLAPNDPYLRLDGAGWDGIVDSYRNFTRDYYEAKAVYAQIYPTIDKVEFTQGQKSVKIPIQNDFDFTDLSELSIDWSIFKEGVVIDSGKGRITGTPHTVSTFTLPTAKIENLDPSKAYYAWLSFKDAKGVEITRRSVALGAALITDSVDTSTVKITGNNDTAVSILAGRVLYIFNPQKGQLSAASIDGSTLLTGLRPMIWRKLDGPERSVIGKANLHGAPDLNNYKTSVKKWELVENKNGTVVNAVVDYFVDDKNHYEASYNYLILPSGDLAVHYSFDPDVVVPTLPVVGMAISSAASLKHMRWFGLGPFNAYPNKRTAPILGVWNQDDSLVEAAGSKATCWMELNGDQGRLRIFNNGYMEHDKAKPQTTFILSETLGRPEKGRRPGDEVPQLASKDHFVGSFRLRLSK